MPLIGLIQNMNEIPAWVAKYDNRRLIDSLYKNNWNTLYPIKTYIQSDEDEREYEGKLSHEKSSVFPHELASLIGKNYGTISSTPFGNTMTLAFAKKAIIEEKLGADNYTDLLAVSLSSPDYIGHTFGPNSIEVEDTYLRLDREIEAFLKYLDAKIGKGQYTFFLTADHAVAHNPNYLKSHKFPTRLLDSKSNDAINELLLNKYEYKNLILANENYHLYLNDRLIDSAGLDKDDIKKTIINELNKDEGLLVAFDNEEIDEINLPLEVRERFLNGYNYKRSGDIQVVVKPGNFYGYGNGTGSTHGSWYPYDSHIPLLWMGWGINKGRSNHVRYMTDIAPTLAALLRIQMPNGAIGKPITEVIK